jgi:hypothetical protein
VTAEAWYRSHPDEHQSELCGQERDHIEASKPCKRLIKLLVRLYFLIGIGIAVLVGIFDFSPMKKSHESGHSHHT